MVVSGAIKLVWLGNQMVAIACGQAMDVQHFVPPLFQESAKMTENLKMKEVQRQERTQSIEKLVLMTSLFTSMLMEYNTRGSSLYQG